MVRDSVLSGIGARLEARLQHAHDLRLKSAETSGKAENVADQAAVFALPDSASQFPIKPTREASSGLESSSTPVIKAEHGVGATFRRKGMLSDVPMPVTRVEEGVVFTTFIDSMGSQEMAFDAKEIDVVTKAPVLEVSPELEFFPNLRELVKTASPIAQITAPDAEPSPVAPATPKVPAAPLAAIVAEAQTTPLVAISTEPDPAPASANALVAASIKAPAVALPAGAVWLADGTMQFGYAPTGGLINRVPNKPEPLPAEFGIGATVRRKGVISDAPMTVTQVSDGLIRAVQTTSEGTRIFEFPFNQFDLLTAAPG